MPRVVRRIDPETLITGDTLIVAVENGREPAPSTHTSRLPREDTMSRQWPDKDPDDVRRYGMDWAGSLRPGDTLLAVEWSSAPDGLTLEDSSISGTQASVLVSGGTAPTTYRLTCRAVTTLGERMDRTQTLFVIPR